MKILRFREVEQGIQGYTAGQWWLWDLSRGLPAFQILKGPKPSLDLSILPPLLPPLLHRPTIATGHARATERLSSLSIIAQHVKAELPSSVFNSSPGPDTHSTGCPPGKRCSCNGPCGDGNGGASGDDSSSREHGSTWRERTGSGAGSTDALHRP